MKLIQIGEHLFINPDTICAVTDYDRRLEIRTTGGMLEIKDADWIPVIRAWVSTMVDTILEIIKVDETKEPENEV